MRKIFDVDIDVKSTTEKTDFGVRAMVYNEKTEKILPHPSGVYLEPVPIDKITGSAAFDYEYGDALGFMKVDLLNNKAYDAFRTKGEVIDAVNGDVDWGLLQKPEVVSKLPHIGKHVDLVQKLEPRSVLDLADVLALIRPAKMHMVDSYIKNKEATRRQLYRRPTDDSLNYFKKSHAVSYAMMIKCILYSMNNRNGITW